MPKDRVRANDPALPVITRRAALAAPLVLLPSYTFASSNTAPLRARILEASEELLRLVNITAPEGMSCTYCAVRDISGLTFDARLENGAVLDPANLQWA